VTEINLTCIPPITFPSQLPLPQQGTEAIFNGMPITQNGSKK
jgi:hypothetical protein